MSAMKRHFPNKEHLGEPGKIFNSERNIGCIALWETDIYKLFQMKGFLKVIIGKKLLVKESELDGLQMSDIITI